MTARSTLTIAAAAAVTALSAAPAGAAPPALTRGAPEDERFAPGEAIVRFAPGTSRSDRAAARSDAGVAFERSLKLSRAQLVQVKDGSVAAAVARLERQPDVAYAQPNYRYEALASPPNDTFFGDLWGLQDSPAPDPGVNVLDAWETTRGANEVIAVVDTGVDMTHPDLDGNLWSNPGEVPGNGLDDDANGKIDDVHGFDFVDGDGDPDDYNFHGTHVAGTAAAEDGNALGIAGVAPDARIMAVRALDGDGSGSSADIGDGIAYAAREGAGVINLSLGGPSDASDQFMSDAVSEADTHNVVVVVAAGNEANDNDANPTTPCTFSHANLICVAAVTQAGGLAGFSNFGATTVDVGAPGAGILSAKPDYGAPLFQDNFDSGLALWTAFTTPGDVAWGTSATAVSGQSATDSPGGDYANDSDSELNAATPVDLTGQRGCRAHFDVRYNIEPPAADGSLFDFLLVGASDENVTEVDGIPFAGTSSGFFANPGAFEAGEASISDFDGRADTFPILALVSNDSVVAEGAYVDNFRVFCRDETYDDLITPVSAYDEPDAGSYVEFNGTSMATPHVSGVAALVRASDPGVPDTQVVESIKSGALPLASLSGKTVTGGTANAPGAIAAALAAPNSTSSPPPSPPPPLPPPPPLQKPAKANFLGSRTVKVDRRGRFTISFTGQPGLSGTIKIVTVKKVRASTRRRKVTLVRRVFRVPASGKAKLRLRLSKKKLRIVRRSRRGLRVKVTVTLRNAVGATASSQRMVLKVARRR